VIKPAEVDEMRRMYTGMICIAIAVSAAGRIDAASGFELRSRSLVQGPARTAAFFEKGIVLGTGGGIDVLSGAGDIENRAFLPLEGEPQDIAVLNGTAYIAANRGGLIAVDISDPGAPRAVFQARARFASRCVIARNHLFVAGFHKDLYTFDITEPQKPQLVKKSALKEPAVSLAAENDLLVASSARRAEIYHVDGDGHLSRISTVSPSSPIARCLIGGSVLYLVTKTREVLRWSLMDPGKPRALASLLRKDIIDCALEGDRGMLLTGSGEVLPFGVRGEAQPDSRPNEPAEHGGGGEPGDEKIEAGGIRHASTVEMGKPLRLIPERDAGEKSPPGLLQKLYRPSKTKEFRGSSLVLDGERFATIEAGEGLSLYRWENEGARLLDAVSTKGFAIDLVASDGILYLANGHDGLRIGRVGREGSVEWIGHLPTSEARDVAICGKTLVLADGHGGVKIIDVTDPCNPRIMGKHNSPFFQSAVETDGERAYLAGGLGGAEIIDHRNPERPKLIWRNEFSEVRGIDIEGKRLYIADGYEGLRILSLDGEKPSPLAVIDTPGWNCDVFVDGGTAYIADGGKGIGVIDVTDGRHPVMLGSVSLNSIVREIHVLGEIVFAAAHTKGVAAIDASRPDAPVVADMFPTVDDARGVFADERFVYLASGSGGVYIFTYTR
jgi:hypothetical protein